MCHRARLVFGASAQVNGRGFAFHALDTGGLPRVVSLSGSVSCLLWYGRLVRCDVGLDVVSERVGHVSLTEALGGLTAGRGGG